MPTFSVLVQSRRSCECVSFVQMIEWLLFVSPYTWNHKEHESCGCEHPSDIARLVCKRQPRVQQTQSLAKLTL